MFLNVASYLLVYCVLNYQPSLVAGELGRLLAFLIFASLLTFVVVHSAEIRRVALAFLESLRLPLLSLLVDPWSVEYPPAIAVPSEPNLSALFQRPPPVVSF